MLRIYPIKLHGQLADRSALLRASAGRQSRANRLVPRQATPNGLVAVRFGDGHQGGIPGRRNSVRQRIPASGHNRSTEHAGLHYQGMEVVEHREVDQEPMLAHRRAH